MNAAPFFYLSNANSPPCMQSYPQTKMAAWKSGEVSGLVSSGMVAYLTWDVKCSLHRPWSVHLTWRQKSFRWEYMCRNLSLRVFFYGEWCNVSITNLPGGRHLPRPTSLHVKTAVTGGTAFVIILDYHIKVASEQESHCLILNEYSTLLTSPYCTSYAIPF